MKKTKIFLAMMLVVALLCSATVLPVAADDVVSGEWGDLSWELDQTTGHLTVSGSGAMESFFAPWKAYKDTIQTVTICDGVTSIGSDAFRECGILTSIEIPNSVKKIDAIAFERCSSLKEIVIPSNVTLVGTGAVSNCDSLESLIVAEGNPVYHSDGNCLIETESKILVAGCKSSVIPNDGSVEHIGQYAFDLCRNLTSLELPSGLISIDEYAFRLCTGLTGIEIPSGLLYIGEGAFEGCSSLTSVRIPSGVRDIRSSAFCECENLRNVEISHGVKMICDYAFYNCSALTSIEIPSSVTYIGGSAFSRCTALTSIEIPSSVTQGIGEGVLSGCSALEQITVEEGNTKYHSDGNCLIKTESKTLIAGCKNSVIPTDGSVTDIAYRAFENCAELTSIDIPSSVKRVGQEAFRGCTGVIEVDRGISYVDKWVTESSKDVVSAKLREDTEGIAEFAFAWCLDLKSIKIPSRVRSIGYGAFSGCYNLERIEIPTSVTYIGGIAFDNARLCCVQYLGCEEAWKQIEVGYSNGRLNELVKFGEEHVYGDWTVVTEATEDADGLREKVCACGAKVTEAIPKLPEEIPEFYNAHTDGCSSVTRGGALSIALVSLSAALVAMKKKESEES